jgi:DNA-binding NarL/FixJ family response regulator
MSNKQVAELMNNSVRTIELRRAAIYDKMDVKSTVELARLLQTVKWTKLDGDANSN